MNPSNILDFTMWTIFDLFDDIYFDLKLILLAIEMDDLAALLEPEPVRATAILNLIKPSRRS